MKTKITAQRQISLNKAILEESGFSIGDVLNARVDFDGFTSCIVLTKAITNFEYIIKYESESLRIDILSFKEPDIRLTKLITNILTCNKKPVMTILQGDRSKFLECLNEISGYDLSSRVEIK